MREKEDQKPALRISHIVYGREGAGNRVHYLVDPKGKGDEKAIPETVALKRWRKRRLSGYAFGGCRLGPNLWRAVAMAFPFEAERICGLDEQEIETIVQATRDALKGMNYELPSADCLRAIFTVIGAERLHRLVQRHTSPDREGRSGVPDLFVYAVKLDSDKVTMARFVEVKKPEERISADQLEEIDFLRSMGLHARVLRLVERDQ